MGSSAETGAPASPYSSCRLPARAQQAQPDRGDMALLVEVALQRRGTDRRQLIRLAPIRGRQRLNQTAGFQPGQNFVECAGTRCTPAKLSMSLVSA